MRIAIATDAWHPQVNGVVRTLSTTVDKLRQRGHEVLVVSPDRFRTIPCPTYPEIRLALGCKAGVSALLDTFAADAVHIATEGPVGWAARGWCLKQGHPFTTSLHTRFPDYVAMRTGLPPGLFWPVLRRFHGPAARIMVATDTLAAEVKRRGLPRTHHWSRGVDLEQFSPDLPPLPEYDTLPRPIQLYVGRVAVEKNIQAFLETDVPGTKVVVGDGPARARLQEQFADTVFLGARHGRELASAFAGADVFVFPSRTDTFGLVIIEALASGLPVAAYPVHGPIDIVGPDGRGQRKAARIGALDEDLSQAIRDALAGDRQACAREGQSYSWDKCVDQLLGGLEPTPGLMTKAA